jgi:hypothetical protein
MTTEEAQAVVRQWQEQAPLAPEALTAEQLAYHQQCAAQLEGARAIWLHWTAHLTERYALGPGDTIAADGRVLRATPDEAP